jgi:predicted RNase H-like HicB family nuclease
METIQAVDAHAVLAAAVERGGPASPLARYIKAAMRHETYQQSAPHQPWCGAIAGLPALHAQAVTREACRVELRAGLERWLQRQLREGVPVPAIDSIPLTEWILMKRGY